jgi:hypothetical protein
MRILGRNTASYRPRVALALLVTVGLAVLVAAAGALGQRESLRGPWRIAGTGRDTYATAEQHRQAIALAKIAASIAALRDEVATLKAHAESQRQRTGKTGPDAAPSIDESARTSSTAGAGDVDLDVPRSPLDEVAERTRHALIAVNKRIDWLETLVYSSDATGSVQAPPPANPLRHGVRTAPAWVLLYAEDGLAVISGKAGTIDVTPGLIVPGLGEVEAIRQEGTRWVVETEKGTIRER